MSREPSILSLAISRCRCVPYRMRRAVLKRIAPEFLKSHAFETRMSNGLKFRGNIINYIDRIVYFCGAHEKYMLHFMRDVMVPLAQQRGELTFLDVGANAGNHSVYLSPYVAQVLAFEPFERVRKQLEENLAINAIQNVRVFPYGLSNQNQTLPFYSGPDDNLGAASCAEGHRPENKLIGEVQLKSGDAVMAELGNPRIDLLKADVEGFEPQVMEGLKATLAASRPVCVVELSETTRKIWKNEATLVAAFPENYAFYSFAKGSKDSGRYTLKPFDYNVKTKLEDVIAIPRELGYKPCS